MIRNTKLSKIIIFVQTVISRTESQAVMVRVYVASWRDQETCPAQDGEE